ncbi:hypothetical protein BD779DRAFT_1608543 [Infundibulicybe gibba]|nr:hypothetical protein BD779DRAFT_1608543 [Infundibulicybe gibba]
MQYGHMPLPERRDSNLESNGSTPFQTHQSLGQALGTHLQGVQVRKYRNLSTSPPSITQNGGPSQHPTASPLAFTVSTGHTSPVLKRKPVDGTMPQASKRSRRDPDDGDGFDIDGTGQGAKHWTDEEKTKLFTWLMGPGQDDHWNALRATKNSCLRECAVEVFESKKTYQALKGCYERNFNLFKQIYVFESYNAQNGNGSVLQLSESDRLREYERRLQTARKALCDVGNITARTIDHWHRVGWYDLFYRRWHGDPATTRPVQSRTSGAGASNSGGGEDPDGDDDQPIDFNDVPFVHNVNGIPHDHPPPPQPFTNGRPPPPVSPTTAPNGTGPLPSTSDPTLVNVTLTQGMITTYLHEREEKESMQRREMERLKMEREAAEFEHNKQSAIVKQNADKAITLLGNPNIEASIKLAASDYLKKLFSTD